MVSNVPRNFIVNICLHKVLFTIEKINSSYSWSFISERDNNSTTSKQNSNKKRLAAKPAPESVSKINPGFAKPA